MSLYKEVTDKHYAEIERIQGELLKILANKALITRIEQAKQELEADGFKVDVDASHGIWIWACIEKLQSLKDDRVVTGLERLERATGVEFKSSSDDPDQLSRRFSAFVFVDGLYINVSVTAVASSDSPVCHKVEVGRRTVEVIHHEIVCS